MNRIAKSLAATLTGLGLVLSAGVLAPAVAAADSVNNVIESNTKNADKLEINNDTKLGGTIDSNTKNAEKLAPKAAIPATPKKVKVSAQKVKAGKHNWRTTATVTVAGKARSGLRANLQRKAHGKWVNVASTRTDARGIASATVTDGAGKFRWYYAGSGSAKASASPIFQLPKR